MIRRDYSDRTALMEGVAGALLDGLSARLAQAPRATLSVPGGTTPGPVFDILAATELAWDRVDIVLNDERWVPESSDRSNMALLRARLIQGQASQANLVPLYHDSPSPEQGLPHLIKGIEAILPISVLLLGMGADMHTASLFPGADQLELGLSDAAPSLLAMRAPGAPEPRITLSAPVLRAADHIHVLIAGPEKAEALHRAEAATTPFEAPIKSVLDHATVHWAP